MKNENFEDDAVKRFKESTVEMRITPEELTLLKTYRHTKDFGFEEPINSALCTFVNENISVKVNPTEMLLIKKYRDKEYFVKGGWGGERSLTPEEELLIIKFEYEKRLGNQSIPEFVNHFLDDISNHSKVSVTYEQLDLLDEFIKQWDAREKVGWKKE